MFLDSKKVGVYKNNDVIEYTMKNNAGIEISILNLGGIITRIITPDRDGNLENIVLAYKDYSDYFTNDSFYGAVIGRFSGRIYRGKLTLEGTEYNFPINDGLNHLHGGEGFDTKIWSTSFCLEDTKSGIILEYTSKDGEEGYPGNVKVKVQYILNDNNELEFVIDGTTDKTTVLNITNHSYFNLSGDYKSDILNQQLRINSKEFTELEAGVVGTGKVLDGKNTPFDFYEEKAIGKDINDDDLQLLIGNGYDHPFIFENEIGEILLKDQESGRTMEVTTNNPLVVIYTMNYPKEKILQNGIKPIKNHGICLETQNPPIGKNQCYKEKSILKPNEVYHRYTKYKFDLIKYITKEVILNSR